MKLDFVPVGRIAGVHGIRGELRVLPLEGEADFLTGFQTFYLEGQPVSPTACRVHKGCLLVKFKGVDDMDAALELKGKTVSIRRSDVKLPEGSFFDEELVGLAARDAETGEDLGKIEEVLSYPAHKVYVLRGGRDEFLVPAVPAFIAGIDLAAGTVDIHMMEGLGTHEN